MGKIFLAYRYSGEDPDEVRRFLSVVQDSLEESGHYVFCSIRLEDVFRDNGFSSEQIYEYCTQRMEKCDTLLSLVRSSTRSKGMEVETSKAKELGIKHISAVRQGEQYPEITSEADRVIFFNNRSHLSEQLKSLKI